jgi:alkylation response protein AidB-like acyl-CoA dehydrogenase
MRSLSGAKNPQGPADPIIVHPDVRRMLLTQKAFIEGARMLAYFSAKQLDL